MPLKKKYYQRPDGLFETIRKINGKRVAFRGKTCAEVDRKMLEYNQELEKGRFVPDIADEWYSSRIQEYETGSLDENTVQTYKPAVKRMKSFFEGVRSSEVKPSDVTRFIRSLEAKGLARGTVSTYMSVVRQVFSHAVLMGDIDINPATEVKKSKNLPKSERMPLTEEEERLVEEYRGPDWEMGLILLYTGVRRSEMLALTWQDIDRQARVVHIDKQINSRYYPPKLKDHLKNAKRRDTPLLDVLADALPRNKIGLIFTDENGDYLGVNKFNKRWKAFLENVGLGKHITPHCFRHSYATICYEAGIDEKACAAFLGDTEEVTRGIYQALRDRHHKTSAEIVNMHLRRRAEERAQRNTG